MMKRGFTKMSYWQTFVPINSGRKVAALREKKESQLASLASNPFIERVSPMDSKSAPSSAETTSTRLSSAVKVQPPNSQVRASRDGKPLSFEESLLQGASRLAAIARGEPFESEIHPQVLAEPAVLEIDHFSLWYGKKQTLFDISMNIPKGKVTAIIGPSGCGKSTLIRCVNRMNDLIDDVRTEGDIRLDGVSVFDPTVDVTQIRKRAGMVFQKPNPFPMSIFENVVYPLRIQGIRNRQYLQEQCERCLRAAALWDEVKDHLNQNALQLSGGQQQRLCIARALAGNPEVLLLDEPCSALDPIATNKIEDLIRELAGEYTVVIVTHNMQQAARVSDYTALLYLGRLIEYGPTPDIFSAPRLPETEAYVTGRFG
jgi:phosphate transport system ATP-binding protein